MATLNKESSVSIREREQEQGGAPAPRTPGPRPTTGDGAGEARRPNLIARVRTMLETVVSEIRKVTWPTRSETRNLTIVVIGISILVGGLLGIVDLILVALVRLLTGSGGL